MFHLHTSLLERLMVAYSEFMNTKISHLDAIFILPHSKVGKYAFVFNFMSDR